jgi:hypothetical protein
MAGKIQKSDQMKRNKQGEKWREKYKMVTKKSKEKIGGKNTNVPGDKIKKEAREKWRKNTKG